MQLCLDALKQYGIIFEKDGKLYLNVSGVKKRKNQRKEKNNIKNIKYLNKPYANNSNFTRGEETDRNTMIPLEDLPENCRRVVEAWNRLRLKTFYGLYPVLVAKVERLLQEYDTDTVVRGIACVAKSSFLLGKTKHKGFKITFCWLLDPENFAKVLSGKYQDQFDEYDAWLDGEPLPSSLTGMADERLMTREERRQAVEDLWNPRTPEKMEAARLLGIA